MWQFCFFLAGDVISVNELWLRHFNEIDEIHKGTRNRETLPLPFDTLSSRFAQVKTAVRNSWLALEMCRVETQHFFESKQQGFSSTLFLHQSLMLHSLRVEFSPFKARHCPCERSKEAQKKRGGRNRKEREQRRRCTQGLVCHLTWF